MKPRIYLRHRVWSCGIRLSVHEWAIGYGYTPPDAWMEFLNEYRLRTGKEWKVGK